MRARFAPLAMKSAYGTTERDLFAAANRKPRMIRLASLLLAASAVSASEIPFDADEIPFDASDTIFRDGFDSPPPAGSCLSEARTRLPTSGITYGPVHDVTPFNPMRSNVDITEWNNVWGHANATDSALSWPGRSGSAPALRNFSRNNFVAIHFKTPGNATADSTLNGYFTYPIDWNNPNADIKISTTCGDFTPNPANPGCVALDVASSNEVMVRWKFKPGNIGAYCILQPNTDYYVNIRLTDPGSPITCAPINTAGNCPLYTVHNYGGSL